LPTDDKKYQGPPNKNDQEGKKMTQPIRILIGKPGLDSHDRGAKVVAYALREAGMEVIYTGIRRTPEQIINAAIEEDVDVIGLSILAGAHMELVPKILKLLRKNKADDIKVILGGPIPKKDVEELRKIGVAKVFTPGMKIKEIVDSIRKLAEIPRAK
jgi:methylmalonyl-CoA mutase, C-terminal domain